MPSLAHVTPRQLARSTARGLGPVTRRVASRIFPAPHLLAAPPSGSGLKGVPGDAGIPLLGYSLRFLSDQRAWTRQRYEVYGPVSWADVFGTRVVTALGPEATEVVLRNREKAFSQAGWEYFIGPFFHRGLMLLDFEEHLHHRRIMQQAFTRAKMEGYLAAMQPHLAERIGHWRPEPAFGWFPAIKHLLLENATEVFVGVDLGDRRPRLVKAFLDTVQAGTAIVRADVPGGRWHAGLAGRRELEAFFREHLPEKRGQQEADLFSALCHARTDEGESFSDDDIVNHMIFLLMAAHDTSTITLTTMAYELGRHPDWQERIREEVLALGEELTYEDLERLPSIDLVMKEALRLVAPVPLLARRTTADTEILGHHVPADTMVGVAPWFNGLMPEYWDRPEVFDPERFTPERAEDKVHPYAWAPFGGGVHKCIGMHFASVQIKATLAQIVRRFRWRVPEGYEMPLDTTSLPIPADGLPVRLERL
jgi:cytochrome P450